MTVDFGELEDSGEVKPDAGESEDGGTDGDKDAVVRNDSDGVSGGEAHSNSPEPQPEVSQGVVLERTHEIPR